MDRYQTLDKVAEDLQAIASGREVQTKALFDTHTFFAAKEEDDDEQAPRKNLALPITVAIIAIAAVLVSASIWFFQSKQNEHLPRAAEKAPERAQVAKKIDTASSIATSSKTSAKISGTQKQPFSHMAIGKNGKAVKQFDFPDDIYLGRIIVGEGSESVSYTHLDVYKRQVLRQVCPRYFGRRSDRTPSWSRHFFRFSRNEKTFA